MLATETLKTLEALGREIREISGTTSPQTEIPDGNRFLDPEFGKAGGGGLVCLSPSRLSGVHVHPSARCIVAGAADFDDPTTYDAIHGHGSKTSLRGDGKNS